MSRREMAWFAAAALLTLVIAASAPAFPLEPKAAAAQPPAGEGTGTAPPANKGEETVETILRQQEELLRGQHFSYEPEGRRDPFESLVEKAKLDVAKRPRGIAGMMVAEIDLDGIIEDPKGGNVAFVTGSDNKGYFLRVGDDVYDGTLIAIDTKRGAVTFRQRVDDPRVIKPYRDVVKKLVPLDEESVNE